MLRCPSPSEVPVEVREVVGSGHLGKLYSPFGSSRKARPPVGATPSAPRGRLCPRRAVGAAR